MKPQKPETDKKLYDVIVLTDKRYLEDSETDAYKHNAFFEDYLVMEALRMEDLEVIRLEPNAYFGFELQAPTRVERITFKATPATIYANLKLEVSTNGTDWKAIDTKEDKEMLQASANQMVKFIRISNIANETIEGRIENFTISVK